MAIFNENLGRIAEQYLRKGSKVYLEGQLETRKWQDQSGQDRYSTEVALRFNAQMTLLDGRGEGGGGGDYDQDRGGGSAARAAAPRARSTTRSRSRHLAVPDRGEVAARWPRLDGCADLL